MKSDVPRRVSYVEFTSDELHTLAHTVPSKSLEKDLLEANQSRYNKRHAKLVQELMQKLEHAYDGVDHWTRVVKKKRGCSQKKAREMVLQQMDRVCDEAVSDIEKRIAFLREEHFERAQEIKEWVKTSEYSQAA